MIHILPPEIANRIAAGEVVERPASVVRELIDNAVDAGASRIDIEIEKGGLQSIRVTDNGCGMSPDDAALCVQRHATSKIQNANDLEAITTKGFRGEALAAISSVAKFELKTRLPESEWGTQIVIEGAKEREPSQVGAAIGTVVTICDLFYNTPARRKFLKKPATEMNHVLSTVTWNALAHEDIHFTFAHNGRRSLDLPPVTSRAERIQQLFGKNILDEMIPVQLDTPALSLSGFISRPTVTRNGAQHIFFFVNDRFIKDRLLHRAMMNGYRNLIHAGRYPVVFIYIDIDPSEIDINVHPTKQEIKFSREDAVFSAMYGAIRNAWDADYKRDGLLPEDQEPAQTARQENHDAAPQSAAKTAATEKAQNDAASPEKQSQDQTSASAVPPKPASIQQLNRERSEGKISLENPPAPPAPSVHPQDQENQPNPIPDASTEPRQDSSAASPITTQIEPESHIQNTIPPDTSANISGAESRLPLGAIQDLIRIDKKTESLFDADSLEDSGELTVLGQFMHSYILAQGKDGLYVIDQHAAHERLLFEQFYTQSQNAPLASQTLLFPITLDFAPDEAGLVEEITDLLDSLGFGIEPFGGSTFVVRSIPSSLSLDEAEMFVKDFLGEVRHEGSASEYKEKALHTLACRAAVKFGDPLSVPEMEGIIRGLQKIPRRNVCPHGRPAILFVSEQSLQKAFKRTGF
ncbi:MAG: DNA mismatch repair endonuclease MutL [Candidatus Omnitrophica bacterium]|nr:DNA mismatch repair endonuclease MutL [Candidatus Omnitrophota bacterium]